MINKTFVLTSIVAGFFMVMSLKFLHFFKFIKWSPIGWSKKYQILVSAHVSAKWITLFIGLVILFALFYLLFSFLDAIPPSILAIVCSIVILILVEWIIGGPQTFSGIVKSISIPLLSLSAIIFRFLAGTAVFMRKLTKSE